MITIYCAACGRKLFRYQKIGKGKLLHCWKERIARDYTIRIGSEVHCTCGNHIGKEEADMINLHGGSFTTRGSALK